jgi:hypothetical protein
MTGKDDENKTWVDPVYRQLEAVLDRSAEAIPIREIDSPGADTNDTIRQTLPPLNPDPAQSNTPVDLALEDEFFGIETGDANERRESLLEGLKFAAQKQRIGPPVVTKVTDGHETAVYATGATTIPPSPEGSNHARPVADYVPQGVHFSRTEEIPILRPVPAPPSTPAPTETPPPASSSALPLAPADPARQAPTVRIRHGSGPPDALESYKPPGTRPARIAVLFATVATTAAVVLSAIAIVWSRPTALRAPMPLPATSSAASAAAPPAPLPTESPPASTPSSALEEPKPMLSSLPPAPTPPQIASALPPSIPPPAPSPPASTTSNARPRAAGPSPAPRPTHTPPEIYNENP